jgi:hypothetical protein
LIPTEKSAGKGKNKKIGRNKPKCLLYRGRNILLQNKLKRITHSNGLKAAESYKKDPQARFPKEALNAKA